MCVFVTLFEEGFQINILVEHISVLARSSANVVDPES